MKIKETKKVKGEFLYRIGEFYCKMDSNYVYVYDKKNFIKINKYQIKNPAGLAYDKINNVIYIGTTKGDIYKCGIDEHAKVKINTMMTSDIQSMLINKDTLICLNQGRIFEYNLDTETENLKKEIGLENFTTGRMLIDKTRKKILVFSTSSRIILDYNYDLVGVLNVKGRIICNKDTYSEKYNKAYDVEIKACSDNLKFMHIWLRETSLDTGVTKILYNFEEKTFLYKELPDTIKLLNNDKWLGIIYREKIEIFDLESWEKILSYDTNRPIAFPMLEFVCEANMLIFSTCFEIELIYLE